MYMCEMSNIAPQQEEPILPQDEILPPNGEEEALDIQEVLQELGLVSEPEDNGGITWKSIIGEENEVGCP